MTIQTQAARIITFRLHGLSTRKSRSTSSNPATTLRRGGTPTDNSLFCRFSRGGCQMHYSDYLREQAAEYRRLAEEAEDPAIKEDFFDSAAICEEVANNIDDR